MADSERTVPEKPVNAVARLVWWADRLVLWLLALPTMVVVKILIGGVYGLVAGFAAGIAVWFAYAFIKLVLTLIGVKAYSHAKLDQEVIRICDDASETGDETTAVARVSDLITQKGATSDRVIALAGFLLSLNRCGEAAPWCEAAHRLAPESQRWRVMLLEAERLRRTGQHDEALDATARIVQEQPYSSGVHIEHAKVLAELRRWQEAESALDQARQLSGKWTVRLAMGGAYRRAVRKEIVEVKRLINDGRANASTAKH